VANRGHQLDGGQLAGHVSGSQLVRVCDEHRLFRHDDDQFYHERGGHCDLSTGVVIAPYLEVAGEVILFAALAPDGHARDTRRITERPFPDPGYSAVSMLENRGIMYYFI